MAIDNIIDNINEFKDALESGLLLKFTAVEKKLFDDLLKALKNANFLSGKIANDELIKKILKQLPLIIQESLVKSKYTTMATDYVLNFDKINKFVAETQKDLNNINVPMASIKGTQKAEINMTLERMTGAGVDANFVLPLKESLYRHVVAGGNISGAEEILSTYILSNKDELSKLQRYVSQVARDGINQYEGAIQNKIAQDYELDKIAYVGSLVRDSRPQCRKWVKMGTIDANKLKKEINWANNYGQGMIPGTTPENFMIFRGGYNCRHNAIPTL